MCFVIYILLFYLIYLDTAITLIKLTYNSYNVLKKTFMLCYEKDISHIFTFESIPSGRLVKPLREQSTFVTSEVHEQT